MDREKQNQQTVECEVLTDSGRTLEERIGHRDTESTDGRV